MRETLPYSSSAAALAQKFRIDVFFLDPALAFQNCSIIGSVFESWFLFRALETIENSIQGRV